MGMILRFFSIFQLLWAVGVNFVDTLHCNFIQCEFRHRCTDLLNHFEPLFSKGLSFFICSLIFKAENSYGQLKFKNKL